MKAEGILLTVFVSVLVVSNIIASKIVEVGFWIVPAAVFLYPVTFVVTDVISEIWGKRRAQQVVWLGFLANIVLVVSVYMAILLPSAPFYRYSQEFKMILGSSFRLVLASFVAYLVSQLHDVWAFHLWKRLTKGRWLWLRNNASTMVSQFFDTAIFIPMAFYGVVPHDALWQMILSQYSLKLLIAVLDTPIVYLLVRLITGRWVVMEEWRYGR